MSPHRKFSFRRTLYVGLIALGWMWAAYPLHPYLRDLREVGLAPHPPAEHPELLRPDQPPTPEEQRLWRALGWQP
ncbi:DUF6059 family protein [Kitasatospora sp. NPDC059463]|uniref:DUF6059 family protein n=1 Tax=unclassified Kitasatospora TaxID=2633591 RepID=UPI003694A6B0